MEKKLMFLASFLLVVLVKSSNGLNCYSCGSLLTIDSTCEDPFQSASQETCAGSCAKYKGESNGNQLVWRTCTLLQTGDSCYTKTESGVEVNVCYCNTDLCNAATTSTVSIIALLSVVAIGVIVGFHY